MCGIAGILNHQNYSLSALKTTLNHRGPDEQSIYIEGNLALVHTRLSIQDVENGQQPFHYGHCSMIFNGEIYNHRELRKLLPDFTFRTESDTETLLYLYIKFGEKMFSLIDGMFAFCIYDRKNHTIVLARDRAGKKPLYYFQNNNSFIFASELNAIKSVTRLEINDEAIHCYLRAGLIFGKHTPYKNVYTLDSSTCLIVNVDNCQLTFHKYYDILHSYEDAPPEISFEDAVISVEERLKKSVTDRLISSDVEVGAFLSGGIDSNLVVAMASQVTNKLKTFTVKFDGLYDEAPLARLAAEKYQTSHTELQISMDINNDIEHILLCYGEPFADSSAIPSYYVSREAKKSVNVVLNGDGADELFGGYRRYVPIANNMARYVKYLSPIKNWLPKPACKQSHYNYLYRLVSMANKKGLDFYLSATSDIYEDVLQFKESSILAEMSEFVKNILASRKLSNLSKILYLDFNLLLFNVLLVKMDIATMANSLEARSPFLSKHILDFAPSLPDNYKVNKIVTKHILRELSKKYLPMDLVNQPKRGFEVPLKKWINADIKDKIFDSLAPGCYSESYIDRYFINNILQNKNKIAEEKRAKILWSMFCLEVWHANEVKNNYLK